MKATGNFVEIEGRRFQIWISTYPSNDAIAVILCPGTSLGDPENSHVLSINMHHGQDHESQELPENCFYVPTWRRELQAVFDGCMNSAHFQVRDDLPICHSGYETAPAWEYVP